MNETSETTSIQLNLILKHLGLIELYQKGLLTKQEYKLKANSISNIIIIGFQ